MEQLELGTWAWWAHWLRNSRKHKKNPSVDKVENVAWKWSKEVGSGVSLDQVDPNLGALAGMWPKFLMFLAQPE